MAKKLWIDEDECIGCESCVEVCPEAFVFDDDAAKAYVKDGATGEEDCAEEAVASCPAECIYLE
ncbi:ferredoxin [Desulfopila inferna]|uniref:ferredoxin n=1 Tax=Desulfopila inferna TaxID=468528 RepID=UPI001963777D|nr:ferredoxin [Desulfopila inferna]MBM9604635.1 ferredoxin [Desulfopila inferna]